MADMVPAFLNEIESESDAAFLERVQRGGNDDWLNEFGNLSDVDSLVYDTDDEPFSLENANGENDDHNQISTCEETFVIY